MRKRSATAKHVLERVEIGRPRENLPAVLAGISTSRNPLNEASVKSSDRTWTPQLTLTGHANSIRETGSTTRFSNRRRSNAHGFWRTQDCGIEGMAGSVDEVPRT